MAANDGKRLTVFGLGFRDHDNRQMQQILRHYDKLPTEINRTTLYVALTLLAKEVNEEDSQKLTVWLMNGAKADEFPFGQAPPPALAPQTPRLHNPVNPGHNHHPGYGGTPQLGHPYGQGAHHGGNNFDASGYLPYNPIFSGRGRTIEDVGLSGSDNEPGGNTNTINRREPGDFDPALFEAIGGERSYEEIRIAESADLFGLRNATDRNNVHGLEDQEMDNEDDDSDSFGSIDDPRKSEDENDENEDMSVMDTDDTSTELECLVCYETLPSSDFPLGRITDGCRHKTKACFACINSSIQEPLARGALHLIVCPLCPEKLERSEIKIFAKEDVFNR